MQDSSQWALRYVVLIWLSLVCMIPFDLTQLDEIDCMGHSAAMIETTGKTFLGKAGLEREGASLLLSRLYMRCDMFSLDLELPPICVGKTQARASIHS